MQASQDGAGRPHCGTAIADTTPHIQLNYSWWRSAGAAPPTTSPIKMEDKDMLWTIAVVLMALWLLGLVTAYTMGGFIHVLLVIAVVVVLMRIIQGRKIA